MTDFLFTLEADEEPEPETPPVVGSLEYTTDDYLAQLQALLPPGKAWTRLSDAVLTDVLEGLAPEFARVQARADQLLLEMDPATASETLDEWEATNGLPDPCVTTPPTTDADRRAALLAKLRDSLGHNPADYVEVAETLGHTGTTVHRRPYPPFRAGIGRAGFPAYSNAWAHVYLVNYMTDAISGAWSLTDAVLDASNEVAPDDGADAERIDFGASGEAAKAVTGAPTSVQFDVWMRVPTGDASATVTMGAYRLGALLVASSAHLVDDVWRRYTLRAEHASGIAVVRLSASGPDVIAWGAQVGEVDEVLECRFESLQQSHTVAEFHPIGAYVQDLE